MRQACKAVSTGSIPVGAFESPAPAGSFLEPTGEIERYEKAMAEVVEYGPRGIPTARRRPRFPKSA